MSILFPTNFSDQSANCFGYALNLAKKLNHTITLLHVYPLPMNFPSVDETRMADLTEDMVNIAEKAAADRMMHFKDQLQALYADGSDHMTRVETIVKMGFVGEEVTRTANEINAAYIVICAKKPTGLKRFLGGGDISSIIKKSDVPVFTVPDNYKFKSINKIGFASDLTFSDNSVISRLLTLSDTLGAQIKCFHVHDSNLEVENAIIQDFIEQYKSEANDRRITFELVDNISITDGIDYYVKNHDIDLLVVMKQKTYWMDIFESSITKKLVFHEDVPMLVYHD
jgi:nucleotide-binding universal stress UspA family protein